MMWSLFVKVSVEADSQSNKRAAIRGGILDTGRIMAELKGERDRLKPSHCGIGRSVTKSHKEERCPHRSRKRQKERRPPHPGRSETVVGNDEEAMGGAKKERFQEAPIKSEGLF